MVNKLLYIIALFLCLPNFALSVDYYWVNGTGNWNNFATHWATTSGGSTMHSQAPTQNDNVFFDTNSFSAAGSVVTLNVNAQCKNIAFTTVTNSPTFTGTATDSLSIFGSFRLAAGMNYSANSVLVFNSSGSDSIFTANHTIPGKIIFSGPANFGLLDNLICSNEIHLQMGAIQAGNKNITCTAFLADFLNFRSLTFSSGNLELTGSGLVFSENFSAFTFTPGSGSVKLTNPNADSVFFKGDISTFNTIEVSAVNSIMDGNLTCANLIVNAGVYLSVLENSTVNFNSFIVNGSCGVPVYLDVYPITSTSTATYNNGGVATTIAFTRIHNLAATGAGITANNSVDEGGNTGWNINANANTDAMYWIGGGGNWNDPMHWSDMTGGTSINCLPTSNNNVYFDANSGLTNDTVLISGRQYCDSMDWTNVSGAPIFFGDSITELNLAGSITLDAAMTSPMDGRFNFTSDSANTIDLQGVIIDAHCTLNGAGSWTLLNDFNSLKELRINSGTFATSNFDMHLMNVISGVPNTRSITLGTSSIRLFGLSSTIPVDMMLTGEDSVWVMNPTNLTFSGANSSIDLISPNNQPSYFEGGGFTYGSVTISCLTAEIWDANSFSTLWVKPGKTLSFESSITHSVDSLIALGTCDSLITLQSTSNFSPAARLLKTGFDTLFVENCLIKNIDGQVPGSQGYVATNSSLRNSAANWDTVGVSAPATFYWIGGDGNWSNPMNWSSTTGGLPGTCLPTMRDTVYFDGNSFSAANQVVTLDVDGFCAKMDWSGMSFIAEMHMLKDLNVSYEVVLNPSLTVTRNNTASTWSFLPEGNFFYSPLGAETDVNVIYSGTTLTDTMFINNNVNLGAEGFLMITKGTCISLADSIVATAMYLFSNDPKVVHLNATYLQLIYGWNSDALTATTVDAGTSVIEITGSTVDDFFYGNGYTFNKLIVHSFDGVTAVTGNNTFSSLVILPGTKISFKNASNQTISDTLIAEGTCPDSIYISSSGATAATLNISATTYTNFSCLNVSKNILSDARTTLFSTNLGGNTNWTFDGNPPSSSGFTTSTPLCFGSPITFTNTSTSYSGNVGDLTFDWSYGNGDSSTVVSPTYSYPNSGIFEVTLIARFTNGCESEFVDTLDVSEPNAGVIINVADTIICENQEVFFTASQVLDNYQYVVNGIPATGLTANHEWSSSALNDGDTVMLQGYLNGCLFDSISPMVFTVKTAPSISVLTNPGSDTLCAYDTLTVFGTGTDVYDFYYNGFMYPLPFGQDSLVIPAPVTGDSFWVVGKDTNNSCTMESSTHYLTVVPTPNVSILNLTGNTLCDGDTITIQANGAVTYQVLVNDTAQGAFQATNLLDVTNLNNGDVVTVIGDTLGCVDVSNSVLLTVNPLPTISVTASDLDLTICQNEVLTFTASGASGYLFIVNNVPFGGISGLNAYSSSAFTAGNTLQVYGEQFGCGNYSTIDTIDVIPLPITSLVISEPDTSICAGDSVWITASGATNYQFYLNGDSLGAWDTLSQITTDSLLNFQTITVAGEAGGCVTTAIESYTFDVKPIPSILFYSTDSVICEGEIAQFTASGGGSYQFFVNGNDQGASSAAATLATDSLPVGYPLVEVVGTLNGCDNAGDTAFTVHVKPIPNVLLTASNTSICEGDTVVFTGFNADMYQFSIDGLVQGSYSPTDSLVTGSLLNGQVVSVEGKLSGCENVGDTSYTMNVNLLPTTAFVSSDQDNSICEGDTITFTASGADLYTFYLDGFSLGTSPTNTISTDTFTVNHQITLKGESLFGCAVDAPQIFNIVVHPIPVVGLTSSDADLIICENESVTFTASGSNYYKFYLNGSATTGYAVQNAFTSNSLQNGDVIAAWGKSIYGCESKSLDSLTFVVNPNPTVTLLSSDADLLLCNGDTVTFTANGALDYQFFVNSDSLGAMGSSNTYWTDSLVSGDVISVVGEANGCDALGDTNFSFTVFSYPNTQLVSFDTLTNTCIGDTVNFSASGASQYAFYVDGNLQGAPSTVSTFSSSSLTNGQVVHVVGYNGTGNECATVSDTSLTVTVFNYPTVSITTNPSFAVCYGSVAQVIGSGANSYSFSWNGVPQSTTGNSFQSSLFEDGDIVTVTGFNGKCPSAPVDQFVNVFKMNLALTASPNSMLCNGESVTVSASGANTYQFILNGSPQGGFSTNSSFSPAISDGDTIRFIGKSTSTGCSQNSESIVVSVYQKPTISPLGPIDICEGQTINLYANSVFNWVWNRDAQILINEKDSVLLVSQSGTYQVVNTIGEIGSVWTVGNNAQGQIGDSTYVQAWRPKKGNGVDNAQNISAGAEHTLLLRQDGTVSAWGDNSMGQLGNGTFTDSNIPFVVAVSNAEEVQAGELFSLVRTSSGTVSSFGDNSFGQLGIGSTGVTNFPVTIGGLSSITQIAAGGEFSLAVDSLGQVWSWGRNQFGQLGIGSTQTKTTPVLVTGLSNVVAISAGRYHALAVKSDGTVWVWGDNSHGQLGIGNNGFQNTPIQLGNYADISEISAGADYSLMRSDRNLVYAFGGNTYGQLGSGDTLSTNLPKVIPQHKFISIHAGYYTSFGMKSDSSVWAWGNGTFGQTGLGQIANIHSPQFVKGFNGARVVSSGLKHTAVVMSREHQCFSNSVTVNVDTISMVEITISSAGTELIATPGGTTYQWYLNGTLIPGATSSTYTPVVKGEYSVQVEFPSGCELLSDEVSWWPLSVPSILPNEAFVVYPNPSKGMLQISDYGFSHQVTEMEIRNTVGELVWSHTGNLINELDLSHTANGMYILTITLDSGQKWITKWVKF